MEFLTALFAWTMMVIVPIIAFSLPVVGALFIFANKIPRTIRRAFLACGFGIAAAYRSWQLWFLDLPESSGPPMDYVVTTVGPLAVVFAAAGWLLAGLVRHPRKVRPSRPPSRGTRSTRTRQSAQ